jgi:hypothetical protein
LGIERTTDSNLGRVVSYFEKTRKRAAAQTAEKVHETRNADTSCIGCRHPDWKVKPNENSFVIVTKPAQKCCYIANPLRRQRGEIPVTAVFGNAHPPFLRLQTPIRVNYHFIACVTRARKEHRVFFVS